MKTINPELVHEAMQRAPLDGQHFRQARAAIAYIENELGLRQTCEDRTEEIRAFILGTIRSSPPLDLDGYMAIVMRHFAGKVNPKIVVDEVKAALGQT
jgi:hypothetical protein